MKQKLKKMKKITYMLLLIQCGFMMAQTKTLVTQNGQKITIHPYANNGLTINNDYIQLGGALTQPSVLTTTSAFTLALKGLQTDTAADNILVTDANGVIKTISKSGLGDNLGNHTATQNLEMSNKDITNINSAFIKYEAKILDRATTNTNYFGLFKNTGVFGIYNSKTSKNEVSIDETTGKTTLTSAQIKGVDGVAPQAGYIATAADASGNIVWKAAAGSNENDATRYLGGTIYVYFDNTSGGSLPANRVIGKASGSAYTLGTSKLTSKVGGIVSVRGNGFTVSNASNGIFDIKFDTPLNEIYGVSTNIMDSYTSRGSTPNETTIGGILYLTDNIQLCFISNTIIRVKTGDYVGTLGNRSFTFVVTGK